MCTDPRSVWAKNRSELRLIRRSRSFSIRGTTAIHCRSSPSRDSEVRLGMRSEGNGVCARIDGPAKTTSARAQTGADRQDMFGSFRVPRSCRQRESTIIPSRQPPARQAGRTGDLVEMTGRAAPIDYATLPANVPCCTKASAPSAGPRQAGPGKFRRGGNCTRSGTARLLSGPFPSEWRLPGPARRLRSSFPPNSLLDGRLSHDPVRYVESVSGQDPDGSELAAWRPGAGDPSPGSRRRKGEQRRPRAQASGTHPPGR